MARWSNFIQPADVTGKQIIWDDLRVAVNELSGIGIDGPTHKLFRNSGSAALDYAVQFNGTTQSAEIPDYAGLDKQTLGFNFWIDPKDKDTFNLFFRDGCFDIYVDKNFINVGIKDEYCQSNNTINPTTKTMITIYIEYINANRTYVHIYINSILDGVFTLADVMDAASTEVIECFKFGNGWFFGGVADELIIYDLDITDYISNLWNGGVGVSTIPDVSLPNVVGYFQFNENTGTTVDNNCTQGTGYDMTLTNTPTWTSGLVGTDVSGIFLKAFSHTILQSVQLAVQFSHGWDTDTEVRPHIHWSAPVGVTGNVCWKLEYTWVGVHGTFPLTTTISGHTEAGAQVGAHQHFYTNLTPIASPGVSGVSSMCLCRLYRDKDDPSDTYEGDAYICEYDFHIQKDSIGSYQEFSKR